MDKHRNPNVRSAHRQRAALLALIVLAPFALLVPTGCSETQVAQARAVVANIEKDAASPEGQQLLADVTTSALSAGLAAASGDRSGAVVAGIQGAASAMRDYQGLPVAPSAAVIAQAAAAGSGVSKVVTLVAPSIETIIANATQSAKAKRIGVSVDAINEAAARGLDAVAAARYVPTAAAS